MFALTADNHRFMIPFACRDKRTWLGITHFNIKLRDYLILAYLVCRKWLAVHVPTIGCAWIEMVHQLIAERENRAGEKHY